MASCKTLGYVHSLESFGSVDGPGVRFVVFLQGCALRCKYCHNPETWAEGGEAWTAEALFQRVYRYRNYWGKKGGITVSGGEPLRQMEFLTAFFELARSKGVQASYIIETAPSVDFSGNEEMRNAYMGEAYFWRAFAHYYLHFYITIRINNSQYV